MTTIDPAPPLALLLQEFAGNLCLQKKGCVCVLRLCVCVCVCVDFPAPLLCVPKENPENCVSFPLKKRRFVAVSSPFPPPRLPAPFFQMVFKKDFSPLIAEDARRWPAPRLAGKSAAAGSGQSLVAAVRTMKLTRRLAPAVRAGVASRLAVRNLERQRSPEATPDSFSGIRGF